MFFSTKTMKTRGILYWFPYETLSYENTVRSVLFRKKYETPWPVELEGKRKENFTPQI